MNYPPSLVDASKTLQRLLPASKIASFSLSRWGRPELGQILAALTGPRLSVVLEEAACQSTFTPQLLFSSLGFMWLCKIFEIIVKELNLIFICKIL